MDHSKSFLDFSSCNTKKFQVNSLNVFTTDLNTSKVSFGTQILRRVSHIIPIGHWDITNLLFTSNLNCSIKLILKSYNLILLYIYNCQAQVQVPGQVQKVQGLRTKDLDLGYTLTLVWHHPHPPPSKLFLG